LHDNVKIAAAMNILHINTERTWRGGEQQTLYLAEGLRDRGQGSEIACQPATELARRAGAAGIRVHPVTMRAEWDLAAVFKLRSIIRGRAIDIVHMHTSHAHTLGVAAARLGTRALTVVTRRVAYSIHRHPFSLSGFKYRIGVDRYAAVSRAVKDVMVADGIPAERIEVAHSGIDLSRFKGADGSTVRDELGLPAGAPVAGTTAHLARNKGLEVLVDAAPLVTAIVPEARIVIVGTGDLAQKLEARAAERGALGSILFTGFRSDIPACLDALDVFVMPSLKEGLGTSILDAMAAGKPVVASRTGGIPEIVEDGVTGLLVPPGDAAALAAAVTRILKEPDLAESLAHQGLGKVQESFSVGAMVEANIAIYRRLMEERAQGTGARKP
jgi:glycosyltransferase involved in cell wall biosynthesis